MIRLLRCLTLLFCLWSHSATASFAAEPASGYQAEVRVSRAGEIDAIFPLANQNPLQVPADWNPNYQASEQRFALYAPPEAKRKDNVQLANKHASTGYPLILFISPGQNPQGWQQLESLCRKEGVIFASAYEAGNNCPTPRRVQIVLDVLQQLRETYDIDPQRTYLAGFSGGGRVALMIAYALPEYFGGVIPICAAESPREESWLRERVASRLSIALVTGESDFNRGEVERWKGPILEEVGIRTQTWVVPKLGHGVPKDQTLSEVYAWLEEGLESRRKYAQIWPGAVADSLKVLDRETQADTLLSEAKQRLKNPPSLYSGLMQLKGLSTRWPDLPAAKQATKLLIEYDSREDRPWEAADIEEQLKYLIAEARGLTAYALGPLPAQYAPLQPRMAAAAIGMWKQIVADGKNQQAVAEGKQQIPELSKLMPAGK